MESSRRFLEKVVLQGDCLVWTSTRDRLGYGTFGGVLISGEPAAPIRQRLKIVTSVDYPASKGLTLWHQGSRVGLLTVGWWLRRVKPVTWLPSLSDGHSDRPGAADPPRYCYAHGGPSDPDGNFSSHRHTSFLLRIPSAVPLWSLDRPLFGC